MKKSLLVTLEYPPQIGGIANYYSNLCDNLPTDKIIVLAPKTKDTDVCYPGLDPRSKKHKVYRKKLLFKWFWPQWLPLLWHTWRIAKKEKIQVILVGQVLPIGTIALVLLVINKLSFVIFIHGMDFTWAKRHWRKKRLLKQILTKARKIITTSQFNKKMITDFGVDENKVVFVQPCPNVKSKIKNQKSKIQVKIQNLVEQYNLQNKKVLLTVGRLVKRKGVDMVIKALPKVIEKIPGLVYVVVGDGSEKERLRVTGYGLRVTDNIVFTGSVSNEELTTWYQLCDAFIMTSRQLKGGDVEGFGLVYLEAGSFGKPVVAGRSGGVEDAVIHGETGLLVNPENLDEIAEAIIKLFTDRELAKKLGNQGRERVEKEFQWSLQTKKLQGILE